MLPFAELAGERLYHHRLVLPFLLSFDLEAFVSRARFDLLSLMLPLFFFELMGSH